MSERSQAALHTVASLAADLRGLGLRAGDTVLVHASWRGVGFVVGGPQAGVEALLAVVGENGTVVVPTHTPDNTDPAGWQHPPVPAPWWPVIREHAPGFDPRLTPSRWMGALAETVRTWPAACRSAHPHVSFAALGARAAEVTGVHRLDDALGDDSPLGTLRRLGAKVLLLGVGHDRNTSLHLAEWRRPQSPRAPQGGAVRRTDGTSEWLTWTDVQDDDGDFVALGAAFEATGAVRVGRVGDAESRLMSQRALVDFAERWMAAHRA
ncbi:Aminoglycoside N(3')-acetyltransferase [Xylanimonas cellulosilytica DSM 15894]|uniref:Aminoglycoside N(3)-acetyltransferase n=1 Tax=Xylanimonas cellulosilytica (strain DSM 15894 / JCM 12276 / CECT 5975 / KCTC 9989 / LMG 20990 / NBRC 107835 / XIL07) TaxID=446471 RepID=D1BXF3_XYLCX|nr:AAC(3) family N-acetyltransferase [Xylanimonas cellulosilytica]ACZ29763.1 Aminoglycoside N(3')-acetyltransferase [Xylanimonas cellulosilytica DSM 15894]